MKAPAVALLTVALAAFVPASPVDAATIALSPVQDATLYENATGSLANGAGQHLFAGRTNQPLTRRALLSFDIAGALPAGATITGVTLTLNMSKTVASTHAHTLHRVSRAWGEGSADDGASEGNGTTASGGDATWVHAFSDTALWQAAGGDFSASASATTSVGAVGSYNWSSAGLVADVQAWLDQPASNFGWMLRGNEAESRTAKRFDSRQHGTAANRPTLTIEYEPAASDNQAPVVVTSVSLQRAYVGNRIVLALATIFDDPDGEALTYQHSVVPEGIISIVISGDSLIATGVAEGAATISLTAVDPSAAEASTEVSAEILRVPGDFDLNGAVDFDDFFAFADHFGRSSTDAGWDSLFDLSPNGAVDFDDFFAFADSFGLTRETAPPLATNP